MFNATFLTAARAYATDTLGLDIKVLNILQDLPLTKVRTMRLMRALNLRADYILPGVLELNPNGEFSPEETIQLAEEYAFSCFKKGSPTDAAAKLGVDVDRVHRARYRGAVRFCEWPVIFVT